MTLGQYHYIHTKGAFYIYQVTAMSDNGTSESSKVPTEAPFFSREQARRRVYELNGWRYTPSKK